MGFWLNLTGGDVASSKGARSTQIQFNCNTNTDPKQGFKFLSEDNTIVRYKFQWDTIFACPRTPGGDGGDGDDGPAISGGWIFIIL